MEFVWLLNRIFTIDFFTSEGLENFKHCAK